MSVKITTRQVEGVLILDLSGRITLGDGSTTFREKIEELAASGTKKILLNMFDITYMDDSGIGEFVSAYTTITNIGGRLKIVHIGKRIESLFILTKIYSVFEIFTNEEEAVKSFR